MVPPAIVYTVYKQLTRAQALQWQRRHPIGSVLLLLALIGSVSVEKEIAVQTTFDPVNLHHPLLKQKQSLYRKLRFPILRIV